MIRARQLLMLTRASFGVVSASTLVVVSYAAYFVWLAAEGMNTSRELAHLQLCFAPAIAGAWIGICVGRAKWTGSRFTPTFAPTLGLVSAFVAAAVLGLIHLMAWVGWARSLPPRPR